MTVVTVKKPPPRNQEPWVAELERLRRERRFTDASTMLERRDLAAFDDEHASAALVTRAKIATEHGHYADAEADYRAAAERCTQKSAADTTCFWLHAEAEIYGYLDAMGRSGEPAKVAADVEAITEDLRRLAKKGPRGIMFHAARAPYEWALGVVLAGPHPEDDPAPEAIEEARRRLGSAMAGSMGFEEGRSRILRAQARLAWVAARVADDRATAIRDARAELQRLRAATNDAHVHLTIDYYDARVDMLARRLDEARAKLESILERDGGHQAALVWRLYCRRVKTGDLRSLLPDLDAVLPPTGDEPFEPPPPGQPRVFDRNLVAELLTERAAVREDLDPAAAIDDYDRALAIRPRMVYAQRRRLESLVADGRAPFAAKEGKRYLKEARAWSRATGARMPHALLVDVGIVNNAVKKHKAARRRFNAAIRIAPSYGFAYEAEFATRRLMIPPGMPAGTRRELLEQAIEEAETRLASNDPALAGTGGLKVEVAQACFTLGTEEGVRKAERYLTEALADGAGVVSDRARASLIDLHRITRRFQTASRYASEAGADAGPRTRAASAWLYAEFGDLQAALGGFEDALREKPRDAQFIAARARTLRLLGRLTDAERALDEAQVVPHRAAIVENERAWTLLDLGEHESARQAFSGVLAREPSYEAAVRGMIAALSHLDAAWSEIERVAEESRTGLGGERAAVVAEMALARIRRREFGEARDLVERSCRLALDDHTRATLRLLAANEFFVAHAYPDVEVILGALREAKPAEHGEDPRIAMLEARLLTALRDGDRGMEHFRRIERTWPRSYVALMGQAFIHYQREAYDDAERCLTYLLTISPGNVAALERLAWTLVQAHENDGETGVLTPPGRQDGAPAGRLRRAAELCEEVRRIEPTRTSVLDCLATIAVLGGLGSAADVYLEEAGRRRRIPALETLHNRGAVYMRLGRYAEATTTLELAVEHRDADAPTRALLGRAYLESDRPGEAAIELRRAALGDPRDPTAAVALATALERLHRPEDAREAVAQALRTVPRGDQLQLLLVRARLLHEQAAEKSGREATVLIDEALLDVCTAMRIAKRQADEAEVEYHRGVLLHARGSRKAAATAFEAAKRLNPGHTDARRASELISAAARDDPERVTRRWSIFLAVVAVVLIFGAVALALAKAEWDPAALDLVTLNWTVGLLLVLLIVAATLPRLTGMEFGKQVKLSLDAASPTEPMSVTLSFRRLPPVPPRLMGGPSAYGQYEMPSDTEGVDN